MNETYEQRLRKLARALIKGHMDLMAVVPGANLRYLTGLATRSSERITLALFRVEGRPLLVLPALDMPGAEAHLQIGASLYPYTDQEGPDAAVQQAMSDLDLHGGTIGVGQTHMRVMELRQLERHAPGCQFVDGEPLISSLRMIKDAAEISAMHRSTKVNEAAFSEVQAHIRPGTTELAIAKAWQKAALDASDGELPEAPMVASGPNGGNPHAPASTRPVERGDLVMIDGFLSSEGYYSDITRTYAMGDIDEELERIYSTVHEANVAAREVIKPGIKAEAVDASARQVIERAGYGEYFLHRTGHGLGLEIHEPPYMVEGNDLTLQAGMTFTVEPGVYVSDRGGVRIEDNVLVTEEGCESLTTLPRELIRL